MSRFAHNRLRFPGIYLEVLAVIDAADQPLTSYDIRDALARKHDLDGNPALRQQLYGRIMRVADMLVSEGRIERRELPNEKKHIKYLFSKCSTSSR